MINQFLIKLLIWFNNLNLLNCIVIILIVSEEISAIFDFLESKIFASNKFVFLPKCYIAKEFTHSNPCFQVLQLIINLFFQKSFKIFKINLDQKI